ncbi:MAG TPA: cell division protein SepF [Epulopiscium sp.]|nr:cell division protein SepF [Candidatus Epulonipiscium sp.]
MSGVFNKMRDFFMGYEEDYEEDYETEEENTVDIEPAPTERRRGASNFSQPKVVNIHKNAKMDIMNFKMVKYEVTGEICSYIKMRKPVVVNMQRLEKEAAQRALDYLTGATYALDGSVEKIADNIFIFSPEHINISTISEEVKQKSSFVFQ